jgi:hypothetical protein
MMVQNIQNQQAQQQAEAKLQQDMAMEEFKTMMAIEEESAKKYGEMGVQQAKDASKFMMDMLNSNLLDVTKVNPQVLERIQAGDLEAMAEARSWLKPGVEDQLKEMAMGAYQNYLADPTYEPTEDELNLFSILGVARSPSSAYARDTQYGSQALAHQYATERQGRSLANQMTMANYRAAKKMTDADAKAVASATPAKPVYRKLGGIDYMIMGEGNPVTVFDGVSPNGTQISWEEFTGTGAPVEVPAEVPAEEPGFWDKVGSTIGGWLGRGNDEPVTDEDYLRELEALGIR